MADENTVEETTESTEDATEDTTEATADNTEATESGSPKTAIEDVDDTPVSAPTDFPEEWAEKMAGGDEKRVEHLKRMGSPTAVAKALFDTQAKLTKLQQGGDPDPFPEDGEDDEKTAWRERHSIPKEPSEYIPDYDLGDGVVIGDEDKPIVDKFLEAMHARNESQDTVQSVLKTYYEIQDAQAAERAQKDEEDRTTTRDTLRDEFGPEMNNRLSAAYGLIEGFGEDVAERLLGARLPDGTALGNDPDIIKALANVSLDLNPAATVTGGSGDPMASIADRKKEIEKVMSTDREAYFKDDAMQKEYQELLDAEEKLKGRNK